MRANITVCLCMAPNALASLDTRCENKNKVRRSMGIALGNDKGRSPDGMMLLTFERRTWDPGMVWVKRTVKQQHAGHKLYQVIHDSW